MTSFGNELNKQLKVFDEATQPERAGNKQEKNPSPTELAALVEIPQKFFRFISVGVLFLWAKIFAFFAHILLVRDLMLPNHITTFKTFGPERGIKAIRLLVSLIMPACLATAAVFALTAPHPAEVYVLATLYGRHATTPAYDHDTLRRLIVRVNPEVVVLDVSPKELRKQVVAPSKAEYPEVIFPLVLEHKYRAYAGEPDEPQFSEIVSSLGDALKKFRGEQPQRAKVDQAYNEATYAALAELWRTPADVNSALTDQLLSARRSYQDRIAGAKVAEAWRRWNEHAVEVIRRASRENPGKRILVLIGVENCAQLRPALRKAAELQLVDVEAWLRREDHVR